MQTETANTHSSRRLAVNIHIDSGKEFNTGVFIFYVFTGLQKCRGGKSLINYGDFIDYRGLSDRRCLKTVLTSTVRDSYYYPEDALSLIHI